ncbi:hypothetical protein [Longimicrobium sp.]|uniref:hypothetical protein n=1 Tax=Longimicrobium sp. TaxID=2029185 RepID=UPI002B8245AA|nr:hypothetical protein [Longimicrobium sp.]HSU13151.1 hypothetical protein [Longimicrobium sp.]
MKKTHATLFAVAAAAVLGACSDATGVSGSGNATMQASAIGDNNGTTNSVAAAPGEAPRFATTTANGTVDFRARVYVQTQAGGWVELTNNAAQHAVVDASGQAGAVVLASSHVEAGTYTRVRVVFEQVNASLSGSLQISTGLLSGSVNVDTQGDGSVTVERAIAANVNAGATSHLLINLNSDVWLNQASATTHTVSETAFASAVQVTAS